MKDKLQDLKLILKTDKRIWAGVGFIGVALVLVMLTSKDHGQRRPKPINEDFGKLQAAEHETYKDLVSVVVTDINKATKRIEQMEETNSRARNDQKAFQDQMSSVVESIVDKLENFEVRLDKVETAPVQTAVAPADIQAEQPEDIDGVETMGFETTDLPPPPPPPAVPTRVSVISPGDSVEVQLLTGVNAPVDGTPYPVMFKINGPISGPDGSSLDIGEARLLAAAQGSEVDGRALFRLTKLTMRHQDGRRSTFDVDGWVVGEDGKRGMSGKLIDKLGRLILATAGVSFAAGLGDRIDGQNKNTAFNFAGDPQGINVDDRDINYAGASAFTDASNRLGQILLDRYEKMVPVVEILSGRTAAAIFSKATEVAIVDEYSDDEGLYGASLD